MVDPNILRKVFRQEDENNEGIGLILLPQRSEKDGYVKGDEEEIRSEIGVLCVCMCIYIVRESEGTE